MPFRLPVAFAIFIAFLAPAIPSPAQDAASARAFLQFAYKHYENGGKGVDFSGPRASLYFHSSLLALIRGDEKANGPGSVGVLDGDPVCGCQDWDGIRDLKIEIRMESPARAQAAVFFALSAPKGRTKDDLRKLEITLAPEHGQWRIYNIVEQSDPAAPFDLRKELQSDLECLRKVPK
jgi:hypothetical protein